MIVWKTWRDCFFKGIRKVVVEAWVNGQMIDRRRVLGPLFPRCAGSQKRYEKRLQRKKDMIEAFVKVTVKNFPVP